MKKSNKKHAWQTLCAECISFWKFALFIFCFYFFIFFYLFLMCFLIVFRTKVIQSCVKIKIMKNTCTKISNKTMNLVIMKSFCCLVSLWYIFKKIHSCIFLCNIKNIFVTKKNYILWRIFSTSHLTKSGLRPSLTHNDCEWLFMPLVNFQLKMNKYTFLFLIVKVKLLFNRGIWR